MYLYQQQKKDISITSDKKRTFLFPAPPSAEVHPQKKNRESFQLTFKHIVLDKIHHINSIQMSIAVQILY